MKESTEKLNICMRGVQTLPDLSREITTFISKKIGGDIGAMYLPDENNCFKLTGSYAFSKRKRFSNKFKSGDGLVGQVVLEKERILLTRVPDDYIEVRSGLGDAAPRSILVYPIVRENVVLGVIEIGTLNSFSQNALKFLDHVSESIAIVIRTIQSRSRVENLLEKSQAQTEALEVQQEELRQANDLLEKQTKALKLSESDLRLQKEELHQTNESLSKQSVELEKQATQLEEQKSQLDRKNRELESATKEIEAKVNELETSGNYKSEFLADRRKSGNCV